MGLLRKALIYTGMAAIGASSLLTPFVPDGYTFTSVNKGNNGKSYEIKQARSSLFSLLAEKYQGIREERSGKGFGRDQFSRIVKIYGFRRETGENRTGTGYILADGFVLTNAHVVKGMYEEKDDGSLAYNSLNIITEESNLGLGRIFASDEWLDIALLTFKPTGKTLSNRIGRGGNYVTLNTFDPTKFAETGDLERKIIKLQFKGVDKFRITPGRAVEPVSNSYLLMENGVVEPGMSGSPVFNNGGDLTGIAYAITLSRKSGVEGDSTKDMGEVETLAELISVYAITDSEIVRFLQEHQEPSESQRKKLLEQTLRLYPELDTPAYRQTFLEQFNPG